MKSATNILTNCPFCLNQTVCSCCGQCVNPSCEFKQTNKDYEEMSKKYHYDAYVQTRARLELKIVSYDQWVADLDAFCVKENKFKAKMNKTGD